MRNLALHFQVILSSINYFIHIFEEKNIKHLKCLEVNSSKIFFKNCFMHKKYYSKYLLKMTSNLWFRGCLFVFVIKLDEKMNFVKITTNHNLC